MSTSRLVRQIVKTRTRTRIALLAALACGAVLAVTLGAAQALLVQSSTFGSTGTGAGQMETPQGVAVDQSTGDRYVADSANHRVDKFNSAGTFQVTWGWGVADGASHFETCTSSCQAGISGNGAGQFANPTSVAVDSSSHDVYVGDVNNSNVQKFDSSGTYLSTNDGSTTTSGSFGGVVGIAVDQSNNLWVAGNNNNISAFDSTGAFIREWNDTYGITLAIAVDSTTNAVYLIRGTLAMERWTLTGSGETVVDPNAATAIAVDPATGNVYAADNSSGNRIFVYDSTNTQIDNFSLAGGFGTVGGLGFYSATPALLVSDATNNDVGVYTTPSPGPPVIDGESSSNLGATSATLNAQVNPFGNDTTCHFEYGLTTAYGSTAPCTPSDLGSSFADQNASAMISGLAPSTMYHFRVVATNSAGTTDGTDMTFTTLPPPSIDSESVANVTATDATLQAQINPNGGDTTYQFQYGTTTSYGSTAPASPVDIGSGTSDVAASATLSGLSPNTTYHFRAVADGTYFGPDRTFTTYAANLPTGLPDNRGYEMVTPANKDSGEAFDRNGAPTAAEAAFDGNRMGYISLNAFPGSQSDGTNYLSTRGTSSWSTLNLVPPQSTAGSFLCPVFAGIAAYSTDLSKGVLADGGNQSSGCGTDSPQLVAGEPQGVQNLFVRDNTNNTFQLVDVTPGSVTPADANYDGGSADLSHVVFDENAQLTGNAPPSADDLYDWSGGVVKLVTVVGNAGVVGTLAGDHGFGFEHPVSADGTRILFNANGNLYMRQNAATTLQVDASKAGGSGGGGQLAGASVDDSLVYFTAPDTSGLTSDTQPGSGTNLYRYSVASDTLTDLTPTASPQFLGVSGVSNDGSFIYFAARDVLASGATLNEPNLYVWHNGTTTFIATLAGGDGCDWSANCLSARSSANGAFFGFTSSKNLTSYDSGGNPEIYLYNALSNTLACASCNPSGEPPTSGASIPAPYGPLIGSGGTLSRSVSDAGQVFFDTMDALLPTDTNGLRDVYEYEGGQVRSISTGTSTHQSLFYDASQTGSDVFFSTGQQLVPQDVDSAEDIYDARVGGGFPFSAPAPACVGDGCLPPPLSAPAAPLVASLTFSGPGNATPSGAAPSGGAQPAATTAKLRLLKRTIKGTTIKLQISVPRAGVISVSAGNIVGVNRVVTKGGTYTITVHLTSKAKKTLRKKHKLKLTLNVRFLPTGSGSAAKTTLNLKMKA